MVDAYRAYRQLERLIGVGCLSDRNRKVDSDIKNEGKLIATIVYHPDKEEVIYHPNKDMEKYNPENDEITFQSYAKKEI
jgi:hypothetical protein